MTGPLESALADADSVGGDSSPEQTHSRNYDNANSRLHIQPHSQLNLTQVNDVEVIKDKRVGTQMGSKGPKWAI